MTPRTLLCLALAACGSGDAAKTLADASADGFAAVDASEDASQGDASDASTPEDAGPCGITIVGPSWAPACQTAMDQSCCTGELACAADEVCADWVRCVGKCANQPPSCTARCGPISIGFQSAYDCMNADAGLPDGCAWP